MTKRTVRWIGFLLVLVLVTAFSIPSARAITDEEIFRDLRFDFSAPGARAAGLGGAHLSAAEDVAAAGANPAALRYVGEIEFLVEFRSVDRSPQAFRSADGSLEVGNLMLPYVGFESFTEADEGSSLSFASVAIPFDLGRRRANVAISRRTILDERRNLPGASNNLTFSVDDFPLFVNNQGQVEQYAISNSVDGRLDAELIHYDASFSLELSPHFSLGATVTRATLDMTSEVDNRLRDARGLLVTINPRVDPDGDGLFADVLQRTTIRDDDSDFTYSFGLHWHPDSGSPGEASPFRMGAVYHKGAELSVKETVEEAADASMPVFSVRNVFDNTVRVPDRYGVGASIHSFPWVIAMDLERVNYSDLLVDFQAGVNFFTSDTIPATALDRSGTPGGVRFDVDDITVIRLGAEYSILTKNDWRTSFRVGFYNAPDTRIRLKEFDSTDPDVNEAYRSAFGGGEDDNHLTVGLSIGAPTGLRFDLAADFSDFRDEVVASAVYRFGGGRR